MRTLLSGTNNELVMTESEGMPEQTPPAHERSRIRGAFEIRNDQATNGGRCISHDLKQVGAILGIKYSNDRRPFPSGDERPPLGGARESRRGLPHRPYVGANGLMTPGHLVMVRVVWSHGGGDSG